METLILSKILSWCPTAVSFILMVAVVFLIKKMGASEKSQAERINDLQACIENKLSALEAKTAKTFEDHSRRLSNLELEYIRRDTFYRELGGWKDDINRLSGQFSEFTKNIIELWKSRGT